MRKITVFVSILVVILLLHCTPRTYGAASQSISLGRRIGLIDFYPIRTEQPREEDSGRIQQILEQEYFFDPPVKVLIMIPPSRYLTWYELYGNMPDENLRIESQFDSLLTMKLSATGYVSATKFSTRLFAFSDVDEVLEVAARYNADECLIVVYELCIQQPADCLGFWPAVRLHATLVSEFLHLDTRTGFILSDGSISGSMTSPRALRSFDAQKGELQNAVMNEWTDRIVATMQQFYDNAVKKDDGEGGKHGEP